MLFCYLLLFLVITSCGNLQFKIFEGLLLALIAVVKEYLKTYAILTLFTNYLDLISPF